MKVTKETVYTIENDAGERVNLTETEMRQLQVQLFSLLPSSGPVVTGPNTTFFGQQTVPLNHYTITANDSMASTIGTATTGITTVTGVVNRA